jgi:CubicO group peptidase (beta-lactamase class C family)
VTPGGYAALGVAFADGPIATASFLDGAPVDPVPMSAIASITKPITATAVMQLVEAGAVGLDQPIATHVPEFRPARPVRRPDAGPVTVRQILSHTSGVSDISDARLVAIPPTPAATLAEIYRKRLRFAPGSAYAYASDVWFLLAAMIERISGVPYPDYVQWRILRPLGMSETTFDPRASEVPSLLPEGAFPMPMTAERAQEVLAGLAMPGGGLWSTPDDVLRFGLAMLHGGGLDGARILTPSSIATMIDVQTPGIQIYRTNEPVHYGLGWDRPGLTAEGPMPPSAFSHSGATGSVLIVDPAHDVVVTYLRNWWGAPMDLTGEAVAEVYAALAA